MTTKHKTTKNWWGLIPTQNPHGKLECADCGKKPKIIGKWERMGLYFCNRLCATGFIDANS